MSYRHAIPLPVSINCSSALSDILFPCCARAVNASALYKPSLVTYPSCLGSTASQIYNKIYYQGAKKVSFYSLPFGQAVASMY